MRQSLVHLTTEMLAGRARCQQIRDVPERAAEAIDREPEIRALRPRMGELRKEIGPTVLIDAT
jgi:hypothetical protein